MHFIEDLVFKVETTNPILKDNTSINCKDTNILKGAFSHLKSMYDGLLEEHSISSKVLNQ